MARWIEYWDPREHCVIIAITPDEYSIWHCLNTIEPGLGNYIEETDVRVFREAYSWEVKEHGYGIIGKDRWY